MPRFLSRYAVSLSSLIFTLIDCYAAFAPILMLFSFLPDTLHPLYCLLSPDACPLMPV